MTLAGRPLLDNSVDATLFVDRESELTRLESAAERGYNTLVTGARGVGKTSLLRAVQYRLRAWVPAKAVYVRGAGAESASGLFATAMRSMLAVEEDVSIPQATEMLAALAEEISDGLGFEPAAQIPLVIIVDDVSGKVGHDLFGTARDELWELGCTWIVAVQSSDRAVVAAPPADAFFDRQIELGPMSVKSVVTMLRRRHSFTELQARMIAEVTDGTPRQVLEVARAVAEEPEREDEILYEANHRVDVSGKLGESALLMVNMLQALGPASASDPILLEELGWTRPRALQVLNKLEADGIVVSDIARTGGQGRPKKVYRLTTLGAGPRSGDDR